VDAKETTVDAAQQDCAHEDNSTPKTFKAAMKSRNAREWKKAIHIELENLFWKAVWTVKMIPKGRRKLGARWVFATKPNPNGSIQYKARYVAKGYNRKEGTDFAPTATFTSMRVLLTIAACNKWPIYNSNFVAAYLNAPIDKEVWVEALEGLDVGQGEACRLDKALYGTKQAAQCW
jgi:hypothetical protein